jgi:3-hydroxyisobutyrate dehydrogenase
VSDKYLLKSAQGGANMRIGFIGIGNMGGPAAGRVLDAGYDLTINDIRKEAGEALLQKGAR